MKEILSVTSGVLICISFVPYVIAIFRGAKPSKASWIIWASVDTIMLAGMIAKRAVNGQIIGAVLGVWIVAFLAFKRGIPGWRLIDKICLAGATLGIGLWMMFQNPILALLACSITNFIAAIPTFVSAWEDPNRESRFSWNIMFFSCLAAIIAIPQWTIADASQPISYFMVQLVMMFILYFRKIPSTKEAHSFETGP